MIWEVSLKPILPSVAIAAALLAGCQVHQDRDDVRAVAASVAATRVSKAAAIGLPAPTAEARSGVISTALSSAESRPRLGSRRAIASLAARPVAIPAFSLTSTTASSGAARHRRQPIQAALFDPAFEMFLACLNDRIDWAQAAGAIPAQFWARDDVRQTLNDCANENSVDLDALIREITP